MGREPDLTVTEAAAILKVHRETVRRWAQEGKFPGAYMIPGPGGLRIPQSGLDAFREQRRIKPERET